MKRDGQKLRVFGMPDVMKISELGGWKSYSKKFRSSIRETEGQGDLIVLSHYPDTVRFLNGNKPVSSDLKLYLGAHTHGGQIWLPILGRLIVPSSYGEEFAYGHINDKGVDAFITSGVGTSLLPMRFMVPPEIAVLTISAK